MAALVTLLGLAPVEGYRFYSDGLTDGRIVFSEHAVRWSEVAWGPGETLVFEVAPDPDFEVFFDSPEGVIPYLQRALAAWSDIPTADIEMRVGGVAEADRNPYLPKVYVNADTIDSVGGYAGGWDRFYSGRWERFSCDIGMGEGYAAIPDDLDSEEQDEYREWRREWSVNLLVHEIGHCLGLLHAGALSSTHRWDGNGPDRVLVHPRDPAMSYGYGQESVDGLSADDIVAASLLRPAPGFAARTGSISGTLDLEGEPASYAQVWALPTRKDPLRDRIGTFSDHEGAFRIEGLEPGNYALWAQPLHKYGANQDLVRDETPLDLDETFVGRPIRVRPGNSAEANLSLRRGQAVRPPPDGVVARQDAGPPVSITGTWGTPCPGTRIRAEGEPNLADGHGAEPDRRVGDARWYAITLTLEWAAESTAAVFDWAGPYRNWYWDRETESWEFFESSGLGTSGPDLDVNVSRWRIRSSGSGAAVHTAEIAWPETAEVLLRFRSDDASCGDGEPIVTCTVAGCGLSSGTPASP